MARYGKLYRAVLSMLIGADLSINHGAVVGLDGTVYYSWVEGRGLRSMPDDLFQRALKIYKAIQGDHRDCADIVVAIDWDKTSGAWGNDPRVGQLITMLVSFVGALIIIGGGTVHYVTPERLRECLGFLPSASKDTLHEAYGALAPKFELDKKGDRLDAWLLAKTLECTTAELEFDL